MGTLADFLSSAGAQAASWYNAVTYHEPVVPLATTSQLAAAQQIQLQQQAQANLNVSNPQLSGILANPSFMIVLILAIVLVFVVILKK